MTAAPSLLRYDVPGAHHAPVLIVGDTSAARARAAETVHAAGVSVIAECAPVEALDALDGRVNMAALWIEMDDAPGVAMRRLLARGDRDAGAKRFNMIVSTRLEHVDDVLSELRDQDADLLVNADPIERMAALAVAVAGGEESASVRDIASDASAARLRQLSEEVSRIAAALARLSTSPETTPLSPATMAPPRDDVPSVSAEAVRAMIRARRLRANYLPAELFADPAWDMLLDLLQAELVQHRVPVSSLCIAAAVPATTALRWIKSMTEQGLLVRRDDPHDGRRVFIEMAPQTSSALRRYFDEAGYAAV